MKDLKNNLGVAPSIAPAARTASVNGSGVDLATYEGAMVVFLPGTITDGTHTPKIQESADNSDFTDVAAADLEGSLVALVTDTPQRVGYKGSKRYIRAVVAVAGATTGGVYGAAVVRGFARHNPVA